MEARRTPSVRLGAAAGQIAGFALVAAVNAAVMLSRGGPARLRTRALAQAFDTASLVALGVLSAALVLAWQRARLGEGSARRLVRFGLPLAAIWGVALGLGAWMLAPDLSGPAGRIGFAPMSVSRAVLVALSALGVPLAAALGRVLARGPWRVLATVAAAAVAAANHFVVPHDYPGVHFFTLWAAAVFAGAALTTWSAPPAWSARRGALGVGLALLSLWSLGVAPSNKVRLELYRHPGSAAAPWLARLERRLRIGTRAPLSPAAQRFHQPRDSEPDVPPTPPRGIPERPIVLLLVVDALRADVLDKHASRFPTLGRLARESVSFSRATAPAPGTTASITSVLTSRYPSQIAWTDNRGRPFPHEDRSVRFPELLAARGVETVNIQGLPGLGMRYGITRGFTEETILPAKDRRFAASDTMMPALLERLRRASDKPLFAYLHFEDAHAPYDRVTTKGPPFERYLAEVGQVDTQLGALVDLLERSGLGRRTIIVLTADHGEAFGEHGKSYHATTLYSEVIHVPLLFRGPGLAPRRVDELVSLVDIAPTVLDFFGVPTPGRFMGQSLSTHLGGKQRELVRPVLAQTDDDQHALLFRDGFKLVLDRRGGTQELYDLSRDPGELENLFDELGAAAKSRAALLESFLAAHEAKVPKSP